ncbi:hypothetical protein Ssed_1750 [Shewanella sediminis HAW-EB3]|uniref:Uncharacterized protein n=1 Tax=Shewanella sediminis (strain HAW-EB3) TaxID=425104 RepID=A8FU38_SHESH|nr:hypothetical protein [Shewanella sediminis]ABV36361.1 hypothetical protein Ssed_1750 [Shewanella sediminis HAW-EB3]
MIWILLCFLLMPVNTFASASHDEGAFIITEKSGLQPLEGIDSNHNGVRDDFEVFITKHYTDPMLRQLGYSAGRIYKSLLALATTQKSPKQAEADFNEMSVENAAFLCDLLVALRVCVRRESRTRVDFYGYQYKYFNTLERLETFYLAQNRLYELLGDNYKPTVSNSPCLQVINYSF